MKLQEKIHKGKPLMWSETIGNHVYVYWRGQLIYKKRKPYSILFNRYGANVEIS